MTKRLLCILLAAVLAFCLFSCGKAQGADKAFAGAMDKIKAFDLDGFASYIAESSADYFDFAVAGGESLSLSGKEALEALYFGISYEVTGEADGFLNVKINSFDFEKIARYVENSFALGTGAGRAEILLSLVRGENFASVYGSSAEFRLKYENTADGVKFFFDSAENHGFVTALGLSEMIKLMAK